MDPALAELHSYWLDDFPLYAAQELKITTAFTEGKKGFLTTPAVRPFVLSRSQEFVWNTYIKPKMDAHEPVRIMVLKERQGGWSTFFAGLGYWRAALNENQGIYILANEKKVSENLFAKHQLFYKYSRHKPPYDRFNREQIHFSNPDPKSLVPGLESYIQNDSVDENVGASFALTFLHFSEVSRFESKSNNVDAIMESVIPTIPRMGGSFIIYESTAEEGGEFFRNKFMDKEDTEYEKIFISWLSDDTYRIDYSTGGRPLELSKTADSIYGNEIEEATAITEEIKRWYPEIADDHGLRYELQCRLKWRRAMIKSEACHSDFNVFKRIYPTTAQDAFRGKVSGVFASWILSAQETQILAAGQTGMIGNEIYTHIKRGFVPLAFNPDAKRNWEQVLIDQLTDRGALSVFEKPIEGMDYYIGADPSLGIEDGDRSGGIVLRGTVPLVEVATWNYSIRPDEFAVLLYVLGSWYHNALIGVETNAMGYSTFDKLLRDYHYPRIYQREKVGTTIYNEVSENFGWYTEDRTKHQMITDMRSAVVNGEIKFRSLETIREMLKYQKMPNGKLGIPDGTVKGKSANLVMASCIALQMTKAGRVKQVKEANNREQKWTPAWALKQVERADRQSPFKSRVFVRRP